MCDLKYIPQRLKFKVGRPTFTEFTVGDKLCRRVEEKDLENPYKAISLTELSHNILTQKGIEISKENDVLFSIRKEDLFEQYRDKKVCVLEIKSLNADGCYNKTFTSDEKSDKSVRIELLHDPTPCMYPHCVFKFTFIDGGNEEQVTFCNYKKKLGAKNKYSSILRTMLRYELAGMIMKKKIRQT